MLKSIADWTPRTPIFYGWVALAMAALGTYAATGVAQVVIGGVQSLIFEDLGWDRSTIAFAVTAGTWTSGLLTPFIGRLADRHGPRRLMPPAALIVGVCYFALAGISQVWHFYAAYIIARAIANPILVGVVVRTVAVNFFRRRRNLAIGLVSTFRPGSGAVNIQIISFVAQASSWRAAYRILGAFSLLLAIPLFLIMRRRPEDIGLRPDGDEPRGLAPSPSSANPRAAATVEGEYSWSAGEAVATSAFWLIVAAETLTILTSGTVGYQIAPFLEDAGMSQPMAALALSLSSLLGAAVNPGWGLLADRFQPRLLAAFATALTLAISALFIPFGERGAAGFAVAIAWGTASGGLNVLGSMMLAQYYGRGSYGAIVGLTGPFQMAFLGLGPTFGSLLHDFTGGYSAIWIYSLAAYAAAALLIFIARRPTPKARRG